MMFISFNREQVNKIVVKLCAIEALQIYSLTIMSIECAHPMGIISTFLTLDILARFINPTTIHDGVMTLFCENSTVLQPNFFGARSYH